MEKKTIGSFISALRRAHGMTQRELGERLFVSDKTVSRWERDECTPDLSLIPAIADLFGITADELLRGERRPLLAEPAQEERPGESHDARSERQFRLLLDRRTLRYKNLSLISLAIALLGLVSAAVINLGLLRAYVALGTAIVFLLGALVCQLVFANAARLSPEEEDDAARTARIHAHNDAITLTAVRQCTTLLALLVFCLPLALVGDAHFGLTLAGWLSYGCPAVAIALVLSWLLWVYALRAALVRRGLLQIDEPQEHYQAAHRRLLARTTLCALAGLLVFGILAGGVVQTLGFELLVPPTEFDNYEDFKTYMATRLSSSTDDYGLRPPDVEIEVEVNGGVLLPEDPSAKDDDSSTSSGEDSIYTESLYNREGKLLLTYINRKSASCIEVSEAEDGLPIRVWTSGHFARAETVRELITAALAALLIVYLVLLTTAYLRTRRRLLHT